MSDTIDPAVNPGWRFDLEEKSRKAMTLPVRNIPRAFRTADKPAEIDPRKWHRIENQGPMGSCFPAGTLVTMADGDLLPIEDVGCDNNVITHKGRSRRVVKTMSRLYTGDMVSVSLRGWGMLTMTEDHVVLVWRDGVTRWVRAGDLVETDKMVVSPVATDKVVDALDLKVDLAGDSEADSGERCEYGQLRAIKEIKRFLVKNLLVYDITVREDHSFVANGLVVHNCQGNDLASCMERLWWVATGGEVIQFSRIFAYLGTQKIDGLLGSDRGSTIAGGIELVSQHGLPTEEQVPYPNPVRYPGRSDINRILSPENYEAGKPYRIRSQVAIRSYEDCIDWLAGGGAVSIGIAWPVSLDRSAVVRSFGGGGRGGHAIAILGYLRNGNLVVANSHGERYGDDGWFYVTPQAFGQMLRHRYTACYGLSDMAQPKPRRVDFRKSKMFG